MPSPRTLTGTVGGLVAVLAVSGVAAAQSPSPAAELGLGTRIGIRFAIGLLVNLLFGGLLVVIGPQYARECVAEIHENPVEAFGWGLLVSIGGLIALFVLAITIVGLIVAIPGAIVLSFVGLVGSAVSIVWVGDALTGSRGSAGGKSVGVGSVALALLFAVPLLGDLLLTLVGWFGTGVVGHRLYRHWMG